VLAAGIVSSFKGAVNDLWKNADYAITAQNNFNPIPIAASERAARTPGVIAVGDVRAGETQAFGKTIGTTAVNPPTAAMFNLDWKDGSAAVLATLGENGMFVDDGYAKDHNLQVGSNVELTFPDGTRKTFVVKGIFKPPAGGSPFGRVTISAATWDRM